MKGKINWYHPLKGFGFIQPGEGKEIFFHISAFQTQKRNGVALGQEVEYDVREGKKGHEAFNIKEIKKEVKNGAKNRK